MLIETLSAVRDMGRLHAITKVLIRHGWGDMVRRLGLADKLERAGHALHWEHAAELARLPPPIQLRMTMEELGPTFVKLGQILAGRADMFSLEWIAEFEKFHSHVPSVPWQALRAQLCEDLGGEPADVFERFDETPLAAASVAQVHRARLKDGTEVIVKIRRPGIVEIIEADLRLLGHLALLAQEQVPALRPFQPVQLVREFTRSLRQELNLATECHNAERIAANLQAMTNIVIPKVHWAYTHERVNVQDYVGGVAGDAMTLLTPQAGFDRSLLAQRGARAVIKMIVQDGFFHADPHPGNVFYLSGNRIAFIDFGMVGRLSQRRRDELLRLLQGLVERNPQEVSDVLLDWAGDSHNVQFSHLDVEIEAFVDQYHGTPLAQLNLGQMLSDVTGILRMHHLSLPSDMALLIKAFITLEGMGRNLDPSFHMASEAIPLLREVVKDGYRPKALLGRTRHTLRRALALVEQLPHDVSRLMRNARRGGVQIRLELAHLKRVGDQLDRAANRLAMALVISALIIGSSIVMTVPGGYLLLGLPVFGLLGFLGAVLGGLWLLRAIWRSGRSKSDTDAN